MPKSKTPKDPNFCGKRANKDAPPDSLSAMTTTDMKAELRNGLYVPSNATRQDLCKMVQYKRHYTSIQTPVTYDGANSCFLDTALVALFHRSNQWMNNHFLAHPSRQYPQVHRPLRRIVERIRSKFIDPNAAEEEGDTCISLRRLFASSAFNELNRNRDMDWDGVQQDPVDVIIMLESIYSPPDSVQVREKPPSSTRFTNTMCSLACYQIPSYIFKKTTITKWSDVFPRLVVPDGPRKKQITRFRDAPALYVQLHRAAVNSNGTHKKLKKRFAPTPMITTASKQILHLASIIIHIGESVNSGHYVALLKTEQGPWVFFDDMRSTFTFAGLDITQALKFRNDLALKNGVGFFYI